MTLSYLQTDSQGGGERKASPRLSSPQFGQIATLKGHHNIVETFVSATANKLANVFFALKEKKI